MLQLSGSITALITPFRNGVVDETAFQTLADWQIKMGTSALVPCGTTGESPTLSHEEHRRVISLCVEAAAGRVPVIAGAGSNSTAEAVSLLQHAKEAGADAALAVTPYYNKPSQAGLYAHFKAMADAVDLPIILYNIPGRCVIELSVETMAELAKLPTIIGVKDATGDLARVTPQRLACGEDFIQLSGEDGTALSFNAHGGHGCISVTSNIAPKECAAFQAASLAGEMETARAWQDRLEPLHKTLFCTSSPAPTKYAASLLGLCQPDTRLPIVELTSSEKALVETALADAGIMV